MSDKKNITVQVAGPTIPVLGLLGVVFVTLKLLGHITWSWWWVTAPFWAPAAFALAMLGVILMGVLVFAVLSSMGTKKRF